MTLKKTTKFFSLFFIMIFSTIILSACNPKTENDEITITKIGEALIHNDTIFAFYMYASNNTDCNINISKTDFSVKINNENVEAVICDSELILVDGYITSRPNDGNNINDIYFNIKVPVTLNEQGTNTILVKYKNITLWNFIC